MCTTILRRSPCRSATGHHKALPIFRTMSSLRWGVLLGSPGRIRRSETGVLTIWKTDRLGWSCCGHGLGGNLSRGSLTHQEFARRSKSPGFIRSVHYPNPSTSFNNEVIPKTPREVNIRTTTELARNECDPLATNSVSVVFAIERPELSSLERSRSLYRAILRVHRRMPTPQRSLGDDYVKAGERVLMRAPLLSRPPLTPRRIS